MSKDAEAKEYVLQAQKGDQAAHQWLHEKYKRFIYGQARKFSTKYPNLYDDFVGAAFVGYTKGIKTLDITKDVQVLTYLAICIQNEMRMYLRKLKKHDGTFELDRALKEDEDGNELTLMDVMPSDERVDTGRIVDHENVITVLALMLVWRKGKFATSLFEVIAEGMTQQAVATKRECSQSYLSRLEKGFKTFCQWYHKHEDERIVVRERQKVEILRPKIIALLQDGSSFQEIATTLLQKEEASVAPKLCSIEGCNRKHAAKGYCHTHYQSLVRRVKQKEEALPMSEITLAKEIAQKAVERAYQEPEVAVTREEPAPQPQDMMDFLLTIQRNNASADSLITQLKQLESVLNLFHAHTFDITLQIRRVGDVQKEEKE